jgi:hypothetical protein
VLHEGRVLVQGTAQAMMHSTSTETVGDAFNRLTRGEPA